MDKNSLRRADLVTSIILFSISVIGCIMSVGLLFNTISNGRKWFESAGLFPSIVCVLLGLCSISLYTKARNDGARFDFISVDKLKELVKSREFKVAAIIIALLGGYIFILMLPGKMYEVATFLYLFAFMIIFQKKTRKSIIKSLIVSVIATVLITFGFGQLAMVPLP